MKRLVFATSNAHKLSEIRGILPHFDIGGLQDIGISEDIEETGTTLKKMRSKPNSSTKKPGCHLFLRIPDWKCLA